MTPSRSASLIVIAIAVVLPLSLGTPAVGSAARPTVPTRVGSRRDAGPASTSAFTQVAVGGRHACALGTGAVLACWGNNGSGQLGDGTTVDKAVPTPVKTAGTPLAGKLVVQVAAGEWHTCALASDSTIACWGAGGNGMLGNGGTNPSTVPVAVKVAGTPLAGKSIVQLSLGMILSCALASDGTIGCWGYGQDGALGQGAFLDSPVPVAVGTAGTPLAGKAIASISAGPLSACAMSTDGVVACWGDNWAGQLGNGSAKTTKVNKPGAITTAGTPLAGRKVARLSLGTHHSCAAATDGTLACWGTGNSGELGSGLTTSLVPAAVSVAGTPLAGKGIARVVGLDSTSCALATDGTLACWGSGALGALGNGSSTTASSKPIAVVTAGTPLAGAKVVDLAAGGHDVCALTDAGAVDCWGDNEDGELGNATMGVWKVPTAVAPGDLAGKKVTSIAVGYDHACALAADGKVACWGDGEHGALGNTTTFDRRVPTSVSTSGPALSGKTVTRIAAGLANSCALSSDNTMACWGYNSNGQLGDGSYNDTPSPVAVVKGGTPLAGKALSRIVSGGRHACALSTDNVLACWGAGQQGQLGDGDDADSPTAVGVITNSTPLQGKTIKQVAVGVYHSCALATDSTLACWGLNLQGQLGTGDENSSPVPRAVKKVGTPLAGKLISQVAVGLAHTCALTTDGVVSCWGLGNYGRLGTGDEASTKVATPVVVTGTALAGKTVVDIAAGDSHSCALATDSSMACWGANGTGQLGTGNRLQAFVPTAVLRGGTPISHKTLVQIEAGEVQTCVLASDGTVACWGANDAGQVGDGGVPISAVAVGVQAVPLAAAGWAPLASWSEFVTRQHQDLTAAAPSAAALASWTSKLGGGTPKGALDDALRRGSENTANVDPVARLYRAFLGRTPDAGGLRFWIGRRRSGAWTLTRIADSFATSNEFTKKYGALSNRAFVTLIYTDVLGRKADQAGVDFWTKQLDTKHKSRGGVMVGFSESNEYQVKQRENTDVAVAYILLLGRAPTASEAAGWAFRQRAGTPHQVLLGEVLDSKAYADHVG